MRKQMVSCNMIKVFKVEFQLELSGLKKNRFKLADNY